jgi:hypothetical protein
MSRDHEAREKLARLADAVMQDILETSDADITAEVDRGDIESARAILLEVKMNISKQLLIQAKAQHEAWSAARARVAISFDRLAARGQFERIRRGDPHLDQRMTMAARNGKAPSQADIEGIEEDLADLQRLDEEAEE